MTLHEAIHFILKKKGRPLSASVIAIALNQTGLYRKGEGSSIKGSHISARVNNYPHLFTKKEGIIFLTSITGIVPLKTRIQPKIKVANKPSNDFDSLVNNLMDPKNFEAVPKVENKIPNTPGLYCIRIINPEKLQPNFVKVLQQRSHNIIYIGLASQSLKKRLLGQELRAKGHGTFFRSLGAILGYAPEKGSLVGMKNQNNYKFSSKHQKAIVEWINKHLRVNWIEADGNLNDIENELLRTYWPLLNLAGNPGRLKEVTELRDNCKWIARGY
ncbi:GIY-YIG nuclease family protein [Pareuzebyella sediminis]|uniref:GIY-YIG nuclease family protein n=1 Tax=Pareuzebyella sediminis TaxID=2607998 RepID=UPI0011F058DB|nr:hypothetical protein [Pareuzebyella sediminis]